MLTGHRGRIRAARGAGGPASEQSWAPRRDLRMRGCLAQTTEPRPPCPGAERTRKEPGEQRASGPGATKRLGLLRGVSCEAGRVWRGSCCQRTPVLRRRLAGRCPGRAGAAKGPRGSPQPCQEEQGGEAGRGSLWVTGVETARPERSGENCGSAVRSRPRPAGPAARGQSRQAAPSCRTQGNSVRADAPGTSGLCSPRRQLSPCRWVLHTAAHALGPCGPRPPAPSLTGQQLRTEGWARGQCLWGWVTDTAFCGDAELGSPRGLGTPRNPLSRRAAQGGHQAVLVSSRARCPRLWPDEADGPR